MIPYRLLYVLGVAPWEGAPIPRLFRRLTDGAEALPIGRALDVGCGFGEDAVYLANRGWDVTGVDLVPSALARAE